MELKSSCQMLCWCMTSKESLPLRSRTGRRVMTFYDVVVLYVFDGVDQSQHMALNGGPNNRHDEVMELVLLHV